VYDYFISGDTHSLVFSLSDVGTISFNVTAPTGASITVSAASLKGAKVLQPITSSNGSISQALILKPGQYVLTISSAWQISTNTQPIAVTISSSFVQGSTSLVTKAITLPTIGTGNSYSFGPISLLPLGTVGKYEAVIDLVTNTGQVAYSQTLPLLIADSQGLALDFSSDKASYHAGDTVTLTADLYNLSSSAKVVTVSISAGNMQLVNQTVTVPTNTFTTPVSVDASFNTSSPVTATVTASDLTATEFVPIVAPSISARLEAPLSSQGQTQVDLLLSNNGLLPGTVSVSWNGRSANQYTLLPGQVVDIPKVFDVKSTTVVSVSISGDLNTTIVKTIYLSVLGSINVTTAPSYADNAPISINLNVTNTGVALFSNVPVTFTLPLTVISNGKPIAQTLTVTRTYPVGPGNSLNDQITFAPGLDVQSGSYTLSWQSALGSGSMTINVLSLNDVVIKALNLPSTVSGPLTVSVTLDNQGFNEVDWNVLVDAGFGQQSVSVTLPSGQTQTVGVTVAPPRGANIQAGI